MLSRLTHVVRLAPLGFALALPLAGCGSSEASSDGTVSTRDDLATSGSAEEADAGSPATATYDWPIPIGWSSETDPFPLYWAPELPYTGTLVLRFAPDFSNPKGETYFSYSYAWMLDGTSAFDKDQLESDLTRYYMGLARTFDASHFDANAHHVSLSLGSDGHYQGVVETVDAFNSSAPVTLNLDAQPSTCGGQRVLLFTVSPHPQGDATWSGLTAQRATFQCAANTP